MLIKVNEHKKLRKETVPPMTQLIFASPRYAEVIAIIGN